MFQWLSAECGAECSRLKYFMQDNEDTRESLRRRLMKSCWVSAPYGCRLAVALGRDCPQATADVIGPYLNNTAIDKYLSSAPDASRSSRFVLSSESASRSRAIGMLSLGRLLAQLRSRIHADIPDAVDRAKK